MKIIYAFIHWRSIKNRELSLQLYNILLLGSIWHLVTSIARQLVDLIHWSTGLTIFGDILVGTILKLSVFNNCDLLNQYSWTWHKFSVIPLRIKTPFWTSYWTSNASPHPNPMNTLNQEISNFNKRLTLNNSVDGEVAQISPWDRSPVWHPWSYPIYVYRVVSSFIFPHYLPILFITRKLSSTLIWWNSLTEFLWFSWK